MKDVKQGQVLVLWKDAEGVLHIKHQVDTVRRAKAWCRANGDAFDIEDSDELTGASVIIAEVKAVMRVEYSDELTGVSVIIAEVKAVTRSRLTIEVDFGTEGEAEPEVDAQETAP